MNLDNKILKQLIKNKENHVSKNKVCIIGLSAVCMILAVGYVIESNNTITEQKYFCNAIYTYEWSWTNGQLPLAQANPKLFGADNFIWANDMEKKYDCISIVNPELNGIWKN